MNEKRSEWPCTVVKAIVYRKFRFLTGYQLDKIWRALLSSRPACGGRWLKSIFLFLYRSNSISVAVLGSSYFVWHMHSWADIHSFVFCREYFNWTLTRNLKVYTKWKHYLRAFQKIWYVHQWLQFIGIQPSEVTWLTHQFLPKNSSKNDSLRGSTLFKMHRIFSVK